MAFFKFRKGSQSRPDAPDASGEAPAPAETVDSLRRRALYRLIGAAVLVLIAVIGFPRLFDTQPRPAPIQASIDIPDRDTAPPLAQPPAASVQSAAPAASVASTAPPAASLAAGNEMMAAMSDQPLSAASSSAAAPVPNVRSERQVAQQQAARRAAEQRKTGDAAKRQRDQAQTADAARARALLEGKNAALPASGASSHAANAQDGHYVVQIGAFATAQATQITRQKAERAGIKTYTETVTSSSGPRTTRVRVGPFASRDEAARALARIKQAGLPGSILSP